MTNEKLEVLNHLRDMVNKTDEDLSELERADNYDRLTIVGRICCETLQQGDTICDIDDYPGLIDVIINYVRDYRDKAIKAFEEA